MREEVGEGSLARGKREELFCIDIHELGNI